MDTKRFIELSERIYAQRATPDERDEWLQLLDTGLYKDQFDAWMERNYATFGSAEQLFTEDRKKEQLHRVLSADTKSRRFSRRWFFAAAAVVCALLAIGILVWRQSFDRPSDSLVGQTAIVPGSNRATLTLADGRVVELDSQHGGIIQDEGIRYEDGSPVVSVSPADTLPQAYHVTTPRGGQYRVTLPDGTTVWLNAATTLTYPSHFLAGEPRVVGLDGEAYFDVVQTATTDGSQAGEGQSFLVMTDGQSVEVLGTEFNLHAYGDEQLTRTTLVLGQVQVRAGGSTLHLEPGHQSTLAAGRLTKQAIDVSTATAWREGLFAFDGDDIKGVMNKLARWYDVEVDYEGALPEDTFGGTVSRFENIHEVLSLLESTGQVRFQVEGRRVKVMK